MKQIQVNKISLNSEHFGDTTKPAVLLIMGATAQGGMWDERFCKALAALGYFVIRYDHRDTGKSSRIDYNANPYTLDDLRNDALAVLDSYGIKQAHFVAASMGSFIAQKIAIENPDRIKTLTCIMSSPNHQIFVDGFVIKNDGKKDGCLKKFYEDKDPDTDFLKQDYIKCKLDKSSAKKVYFLHGSWFIQQDKQENLRKLSFSGGSRYSIDNLYEGEKKPFLILEDRHNVKKDMCTSETEVYFKHCYKQLKDSKGRLLVFGLSFANDDHILDVLNKRRSKIYITHIGCDVPKELKGKIEKKLTKVKYEFIPIQENVIWDNVYDEK